MPAASVLLTVKRGSTLRAKLQVLRDGVAADLTGCTGYLYVLRARQDDAAPLLSFTQAAGAGEGTITVLDPTVGQLLLSASADLMRISRRSCWGALQFVHPTDGLVEIPSHSAGDRWEVVGDLVPATS